MGKNKKLILSLSICTIIFIITMAFFTYLNYIDFSVIKAIYLPMYLIILAAILLKQFAFSYIFISSLAIGLLVEYLTYKNQLNPNMRGAFLNITILLIGVIGGIVAQLFLKMKKKNSQWKRENKGGR